MSVIKFEHVTKSFGKQKVIDNLSFEIEENSICGFLGLNGAGKTTSFRLLNGLIEADSGQIELFGKKLRVTRPDARIKFLQDVPDFYGYMTAHDYLKFICELNRLDQIERKISDALEQVDLASARNKRIGKFSRGMKQRLGIAANIIAEPEILLLDEPVSALDPAGRKAVFDLIESLKGKMTILFSTHIIDDVERVSDKIIMIHQGKKILDGSVAEMKEQFKTEALEIDFVSADDMQQVSEKFSAYQPSADRNKLRLQAASNLKNLQQDVFRTLSERAISVDSVKIARPSLEEIFMMEVNQSQKLETGGRN